MITLAMFYDQLVLLEGSELRNLEEQGLLLSNTTTTNNGERKSKASLIRLNASLSLSALDSLL